MLYYISLNNDSMMTATSSHTSRHKKMWIGWWILHFACVMMRITIYSLYITFLLTPKTFYEMNIYCVCKTLLRRSLFILFFLNQSHSTGFWYGSLRLKKWASNSGRVKDDGKDKTKNTMRRDLIQSGSISPHFNGPGSTIIIFLVIWWWYHHLQWTHLMWLFLKFELVRWRRGDLPSFFKNYMQTALLTFLGWL